MSDQDLALAGIGGVRHVTRLAAERMTTVYETLERPMVRVLGDMERTGVKVDKAILSRLTSTFSQRIHRLEEEIYTLAGHKGAVTVATNMAGRGTDIMLGGSIDFLADDELRKQGLDPHEDGDAYETAWPAMVERIKSDARAALAATA